MEVKEAMQKAVRALLSNGSYHDLNEEQKAVVVEFETELWKPKVDEMRESMSLLEISEVINNWWLNYEIADETEVNLTNYILSQEEEQKTRYSEYDNFELLTRLRQIDTDLQDFHISAYKCDLLYKEQDKLKIELQKRGYKYIF